VGEELDKLTEDERLLYQTPSLATVSMGYWGLPSAAGAPMTGEQAHDFDQAIEDFISHVEGTEDIETKYKICLDYGIMIETAIERADECVSRFWEAVSVVPGFKERRVRDREVWDTIERKHKRQRPSMEMERVKCLSRISDTWGDTIAKRLQVYGITILRLCAAQRRTWPAARVKVQRAAIMRLESPARGKPQYKRFLSCDFRRGLDPKCDLSPPSPAEIAAVGCQTDEDGFFVENSSGSNRDGTVSKSVGSRKRRQNLDSTCQGPDPGRKRRRAEAAANRERMIRFDAIRKAAEAIEEPESSENFSQVAAIVRSLKEVRPQGQDTPQTMTDADTVANPCGLDRAQEGREGSVGEEEPQALTCSCDLGTGALDKVKQASKDGVGRGDIHAVLSTLKENRLPQLCPNHALQVAQAIGLADNANPKELQYRVNWCVQHHNDLDSIKKSPGRYIWFTDGIAPTWNQGWGPSRIQPRRGITFNPQTITPETLQRLLAPFCNLDEVLHSYDTRGFLTIPDLFPSQLFQAQAGGHASRSESVARTALKEASIYDRHVSRDEHERLLPNLQFGVVQQALRSNVLIYLLHLAIRRDGEHRLYAYPSPAEYLNAPGPGAVVTVSENPEWHYPIQGGESDRVTYAEFVVQAPSAVDERAGVLPCAFGRDESTSWWKDLRAAGIAKDGMSREFPAEEALAAAKWDRDEFTPTESDEKPCSISFIHPCAPRIRPRPSRATLRIPLTMAAASRVSDKRCLERDSLGTIDEVREANRELVSVTALPDGRPLPHRIMHAWGPTSRFRPDSRIGCAILGDIEWDDPSVIRELRRLFDSVENLGERFVRENLEHTIEAIKRDSDFFFNTEADIYGEAPETIDYEETVGDAARGDR